MSRTSGAAVGWQRGSREQCYEPHKSPHARELTGGAPGTTRVALSVRSSCSQSPGMRPLVTGTDSTPRSAVAVVDKTPAAGRSRWQLCLSGGSAPRTRVHDAEFEL